MQRLGKEHELVEKWADRLLLRLQDSPVFEGCMSSSLALGLDYRPLEGELMAW